jgi:hypothetical protein
MSNPAHVVSNLGPYSVIRQRPQLLPYYRFGLLSTSSAYYWGRCSCCSVSVLLWEIVHQEGVLGNIGAATNVFPQTQLPFWIFPEIQLQVYRVSRRLAGRKA